jgi:hypothetical protein
MYNDFFTEDEPDHNENDEAEEEVELCRKTGLCTKLKIFFYKNNLARFCYGKRIKTQSEKYFKVSRILSH